MTRHHSPAHQQFGIDTQPCLDFADVDSDIATSMATLTPVCDSLDERHAAMLLTAFGPVIAAALGDPTVIEIMVNPDGALWLDRWEIGRVATGERLASTTVERIIRLVASHLDINAGPLSPIISGELPDTILNDGTVRFEGLMPPLAPYPCFAMRKAYASTLTLMDFVKAGIATPEQAHLLAAAVQAQRSILVVGGTSSGKTTLAGALLNELATTRERIIILEDTPELLCRASDVVRLRTRAGVADLRTLVRSTLRLRPDRIIVGEVRGAEALDLLKAWTTGHPGGIATLHAETAAGALERLEQLALEASPHVPRVLIAQAVQLIVVVKRIGHQRRLTDIVELTGLDPDHSYNLHPIIAAPALLPDEELSAHLTFDNPQPGDDLCDPIC